MDRQNPTESLAAEIKCNPYKKMKRKSKKSKKSEKGIILNEISTRKSQSSSKPCKKVNLHE